MTVPSSINLLAKCPLVDLQFKKKTNNRKYPCNVIGNIISIVLPPGAEPRGTAGPLKSLHSGGYFGPSQVHSGSPDPDRVLVQSLAVVRQHFPPTAARERINLWMVSEQHY